MLRPALLVFALASTFPVASPGESPAPDLDAAVERLAPGLVEQRHYFHQHPELSNREVETGKRVAAYLRKIGLDEVRTGIAHTGVIGILRGGRPGPVVAVRADIDALPVTEDTPYPFASTVRTTYLGQEVGVSHACGHDVHTAVLLGVASVLVERRDQLPGTVLFLFQPAEEGAPAGEEGGAPLVIAEGALDDPRPSAFFALHTGPELEVGQVGLAAGPVYASSDRFEITIRGKQAHGAAPHKSIDPIVTASQVVLALQTIRSRTLPPLEPSVISVGILRSGERHNIIPAQAWMEGTVRTYDEEVRDTIERRMGEILAGITQAAGASYELVYDRGNPPTYNDPELYSELRPSLERALGSENVVTVDPLMAAEDFANYNALAPGLYFALGTTLPGTHSGWNHTPNFMADDSSVAVGMRALSHLVVDYLEARAE